MFLLFVSFLVFSKRSFSPSLVAINCPLFFISIVSVLCSNNVTFDCNFQIISLVSSLARYLLDVSCSVLLLSLFLIFFLVTQIWLYLFEFDWRYSLLGLRKHSALQDDRVYSVPMDQTQSRCPLSFSITIALTVSLPYSVNSLVCDASEVLSLPILVPLVLPRNQYEPNFLVPVP